ncbi:MAG: type I toxin-antitoxin system SymE family toxin [Spongiibacteraceae bacterium]|nr:type I toxin-antitoxin system SymE family toxin [Spongiibacteraceae bacterium]
MTAQTKHIKVNKIYYDYKPKNAGPYSVTPPVPWIQLKGKWLAKSGFTIDTPIKVEVANGRLVLTTE